jgi:pimeloyl-ACP methyl ester carboxylesterase
MARLKVAATAVVVLIAAGIATVAANWAPDRSVAELSARWAQPPSQFIDVDGLSVHFRDQGPRDDLDPIVLLHGTSSSLHTWEGWVAELAKKHRVITLDLPGFALTGPFPDGDYHTEHYVQFMHDLLDQLGIARCVLGGNSFGGQIAWTTALSLPKRVDKLILVDAAGYPRASTSVPIGFRLAQMPVVSQLMRVTLPRALVVSSVRNVYGDPSKVTPLLVDRYYELTLRAGNRAALSARLRQSAASAAWVARIPELRLPTLILWGERDRLIPPQLAQRFHREISSSELVTFDDLGHVPQEEDPARTVAAAEAFLASH